MTCADRPIRHIPYDHRPCAYDGSYTYAHAGMDERFCGKPGMVAHMDGTGDQGIAGLGMIMRPGTKMAPLGNDDAFTDLDAIL